MMMRGAGSLVTLALVWTMALFAAPFGVGSSVHLASRSAALIYAAGSVVCHQRPERSFFEHGHPMPVCARCTGLYVSALLGGLLALAWARRTVEGGRARWLLALASAPTAVTWLGEVAGVVHPSNAVRALAALSLGAAAAWVIVAMMANDRV